MSEQASGVVAFIKKNDYGFYSIKVDDTWYGTGSKKDPGVEKGDKVEFDFYMKDDKWATIKGKVNKTGKAPASSKASSGTSSGGSTKDGYWEAKSKHEQEVVEPKLTRQFAVREANVFITNAIAAGTLAGLLKKDGLTSLKALLIDLARELEEFANGPKAAAAKPQDAPVEESSETEEDESEELEE